MLLTSLAFLVACLISFRALFTQREHRSYEQQVRLRGLDWRDNQSPKIPSAKSPKTTSIMERMKSYHNALIQSFKDLETERDLRLPEPESGRFSPTFLTEIDSGSSTEEKPSLENDAFACS